MRSRIMITQSHMSLALAVFGRKLDPKMNAPIIWGALIPDISMFALIAYEMIIGTPMKVIFDERYFSPLWQGVVGISNSIPLFILIAVVGYFTKKRWAILFAGAALLHIAFDLPLHHDDAHMHFYPLSEYKFISPVSYWDSRHYAQYWVPIELAIILASTYIGFKALVTNWGKVIFSIVMATAVLMQLSMIYGQITGREFG